MRSVQDASGEGSHTLLFSRKPEVRSQLGRPRHRYENNIKIENYFKIFSSAFYFKTLPIYVPPLI
jgi:hypothetical protein